MRVISGNLRGKRLFSPSDNKVRPTTDRIKETMFNILQSKIDWSSCNVLDLFCGSGALGLEALSRGAKGIIFVDKDPNSVKLTNQNLAHCKVKAQVYNADYRVALRKLQGQKFDLILLDPPYNEKYEKELLKLIQKYEILNKNGLIILEHSTDISLINFNESYIIDTRECGNTSISVIKSILEV